MTSERPLPTYRLGVGTVIVEANPREGQPVTLDSPALLVMTDLSKVRAVVTASSTSLREAEQLMIRQGVRLLFVVDSATTCEGLVTATDLHGERQMRLVAERAAHYDELSVADVMTSLSNLDAIYLEQMNKATVSEVIATLARLGRDHLLVVERRSAGDAGEVCGIVSRTQIERQSGLVIDTARVASTFAEVERALF